MPPVKANPKLPGNVPAVRATMGWEQFAAAKQRRQRDSRYAPFILALTPRAVYDASATFPGMKADTLRTAVYGQARKLHRKITVQIIDGKTLVALIEAPSGKEK